jgi:hypothetical protein
MKTFVLCAGLLLLSCPVWAEGRYVTDEKVIYVTPREEDVLRINVSMGFCTVLEVPEKPIMVTVGDNTLLQVEVPKNSKNIVIKPLENTGVTNLFVFTQNKRFNYEVTVKADDQADYVVDAKASGNEVAGRKKTVSTSLLLKMAKNYTELKKLNNYDSRIFTRKDLFYPCVGDGPKVNVIEAFTYQDPHYLILHIVVSNAGNDPVELNEKNTNIYIQSRDLTPHYVLFDAPRLKPGEKTDAWLFLEGTHISMENHFTFGIGMGDKEYVCH